MTLEQLTLWLYLPVTHRLFTIKAEKANLFRRSYHNPGQGAFYSSPDTRATPPKITGKRPP
ncbi:hypothetical protein [Zhihengliuella salsuginis]|uniref:RES domain-containing protein n=1 Tax=Zhihengliuella salsuginis TaxID=578222 RepID=A0ABQ3GDF3_9MICC|nr:hypothetical protein [Zhihengliuella salsuginis]GHD01176.1 hypothetical protein GCM10008096_04990 [Zhihengliuella salsuginis]